MTRRFGFECELSAGALDTLDLLVRGGLASPRNRTLHSYHCNCEEVCDYESEWAIRGQRDCTADGELITKILTYPSDEADSVIAGLSGALLQARAQTNTDVGFHVHVDRGDMDNASTLRLYRMFLRYQDDLAELASTRFRSVRDYNSPMMLARYRQVRDTSGSWGYRDVPIDPDEFWNNDDLLGESRPGYDTIHNWVAGAWLARKTHTHEFRIWNATRAEWRMHLAVGVSTAMVNACVDGVSVKQNTEQPLEFVLGDYLDDRTWAGIIRQRHFKGGIAA